MKEIFKAIDDAYFLLDKCIDKLLKGRITKDEKLEQEAHYDMERAVNGTMQNLSYLEGRLKGKTLNEWIKVEDKLPEIGEEVFVTYKSSQCEDVGFRTGHREKWRFAITDKNDFILNIGEEKVTHWLPIVPPKED